MRPLMIIGILLIVLGVCALMFQGITYFTTERVGQAGPFAIDMQKPHTIILHPLVGTRPHRVGRVLPNANGRAQLVFRLPRLAADVYGPWLRVGRTFVAGRGRLSMAALPPTGFGPPGAPGARPRA